jgi:hypothetical protein
MSRLFWQTARLAGILITASFANDIPETNGVILKKHKFFYDFEIHFTNMIIYDTPQQHICMKPTFIHMTVCVRDPYA